MKIQVTEEHIKKGVPENCRLCAVALAVKEKVGQKYTVSVMSSSDYDGYYFSIYEKEKDFYKDNRIVDSEMKLFPFINEFDYFGYVGEAKQGFTPRFRGRKDASLGLTKPKRKLSAWNKYVKANSKKPRFRYRNGKLNLKKMAVAFRKTRKRGGKR